MASLSTASARIGPQAVASLSASLGPGPFAGVLVFGDPDGLRAAGVVDELVAAFPGATVVGCTTAGEVAPSGYTDGTITAVAFPAAAYWVAARRIALDALSASAVSTAVDCLRLELASKGRPLNAKSCFAMVLSDGLSHAEEDLTYLAQLALGDVALFGGSAGDGLRFERSQVLVNGSLETNTAALVVISSDRPFAVVRTQHFEPTNQKFVVTGALVKERIVTELDGRPAAEVYAEAVGLPLDAVGPSVFARFPLMVGAGGEWYVRSISRVLPDHSLLVFCAIEEGLVLTLGTGRALADNLARCLDAAAARVGPLQLVLGCDCLHRRLEAFEAGEAAALADVFRRHHVVGFNTYGEQIGTMHVNQTFTGVALG